MKDEGSTGDSRKDEIVRELQEKVERRFPRLTGAKKQAAMRAEARAQIRYLKAKNILFYRPLIVVLTFIETTSRSSKRTRPPFHGLMHLTDWVPFPAIRKRQKKLIADEAAEILELQKAGRHRVAGWRAFWLWMNWSRYLLTGPISALIKALAHRLAS